MLKKKPDAQKHVVRKQCAGLGKEEALLSVALSPLDGTTHRCQS